MLTIFPKPKAIIHTAVTTAPVFVITRRFFASISKTASTIFVENIDAISGHPASAFSHAAARKKMSEGTTAIIAHVSPAIVV
jgi:hypothetical protein